MLSYVVALVACLVLFYQNTNTNTNNTNSPHRNTIRRTPRPQINQSLLASQDGGAPGDCLENTGYKVHLFSKEPLVVYIEGFISEEERNHLLEIRYVYP